MRDLARDLKAFVSDLKKRPDVTVTVAEIGKKAPRAALAQLDVPDELRALYAEMNGLHVEWRFVEPEGGGTIRVPPITEWTRFQGDDKTYMGFPDHEEALLFDEITPEGATWIVRDRATRSHRLVFAPAACANEGVIPAGSIEEYLRKAMANGFGHWWPMCFRSHAHVSYAAQEEAIRRFQAPPRKPAAIRRGVRVHFGYFAEGGRGEVLAVHEAPESGETPFHGTTIVEVRLDEGSVCWIPAKFMKAWKKQDAYESLRAGLPDAAHEEPLPILEELARAIGPLSHYKGCSIGGITGNTRPAAGLLSAHATHDAVDFLATLHERAVAAQLSFTERAALAKTGAELNTSEWARHGWQHSVGETFAGLFGGLLMVLHHRSADARVPAADLVGEERIERLARCGKAAGLVEVLRAGNVLEKPSWGSDYAKKAAPILGLPEGAVLLSGTGF